MIINPCRVRLRARTPPFHGGDTGSNPVRGTKTESPTLDGGFLFSEHVEIYFHKWSESKKSAESEFDF